MSLKQLHEKRVLRKNVDRHKEQWVKTPSQIAHTEAAVTEAAIREIEGIKAAKNLRIGDRVKTSDGRIGTVAGIVRLTIEVSFGPRLKHQSYHASALTRVE